jgi:ribosomal protein S27E
MRFFERFWSGLFGRAEPVKVKAPAAAPAANLYVVAGANDTPPLAPIPKWTHAGSRGKKIWCPACTEATHVYSFGWAALQCSSCKVVTEKSGWLMPVRRILKGAPALGEKGEM